MKAATSDTELRRAAALSASVSGESRVPPPPIPEDTPTGRPKVPIDFGSRPLDFAVLQLTAAASSIIAYGVHLKILLR